MKTQKNTKKNTKKKQKLMLRNAVVCLLAAAVVGMIWLDVGAGRHRTHSAAGSGTGSGSLPPGGESGLKPSGETPDVDCPRELKELAKRNPETLEFVNNYPNRASYIGKEIDLKADAAQGKAPLFLQWDLRWGYESYGSSMIAISGCGPTCLSMAYVSLTGDLSGNPRKMAEFAEENGYYTNGGTSWLLWTEGAGKLGLSGTEISLDEFVMKRRLDAGGIIICSMRPGDFTTTGHFIVIYGYGAKGFFVNDPNSKSNSEKTWNYDTIARQIKNLWALEINK